MEDFGAVNRQRLSLLIVLMTVLLICLSPFNALGNEPEDRNSFSMSYSLHIYEGIEFFYADGYLLVCDTLTMYKSQNFIKKLSVSERDMLFALLDLIDFSNPMEQDKWTIAQKGMGSVDVWYKNQQASFEYIPTEQSAYRDLVKYVLQIAPEELEAYRKGT